MRAEPTCPRCAGPIRAPNAWSSDWICGAHGAVLPRAPAKRPSGDGLATVVRDTRVPVWTPWPLPPAWLVTGFGAVGDERSGGRASAVALSGPNLLSGPADMLLIAEEIGVGLGAYYAGLPGPDPGSGFDTGPPHTKIDLSGPSATCARTVPLWSLESGPDRAVYAGEAMGDWLWVVLWPAEAGVLMADRLTLLDLREPGMEVDLPYGAPSPRLDE
ncbi:DUF6758 family protein [Actinomadura hibisca]|uniref:DUF6758 family protein n=1 Tax=Actinomadura hibisca TaxID=68565 RepID=UPI0008346303|nr:DUF6758 family protein [Actinomadura hibisca]